jgi:MarR family transcriptional regulator, organic hydroperoxide resistance regulator
MSKIDPAKIWSLTYQLIMSVASHVAPDVTLLGLEIKELFLLAELEAHPYPAELAALLSMPKPTVTVYLKRLEAAGFVSREIDAEDMRRHRLRLTPAGRKVLHQGTALLSGMFGERLGRLSAAQQEELRLLLEKMTGRS